jgi:putative ABC transport system permease protein
MIKLSTLAVRNIKRNFKRYVMYFFSLCFSVFTAYTFFALMENELVSNAFTYDEINIIGILESCLIFAHQ